MKTLNDDIDFQYNTTNKFVLEKAVTATIDASLTQVGSIGYDTTLNTQKYRDNVGIKNVASREWVTANFATSATPSFTGTETHTSVTASSGTTQYVTFTQVANTGGISRGFLWTAGPHTNQTTATEVTDINYDLSAVLKLADGTVALQRSFVINSRTITPQTTALTLTIASAFDVSRIIPGSGTTITTNYVQRWLYDSSNYMGLTIGSTGDANFTNTGSSGRFLFNNNIFALGGFGMSTTTTNGNFYVGANGTATHNTSVSELLFAGASTVYSRTWMRGSTNMLPAANASYASFIVGTQAATIAATGTHSLFANVVINPISVTAGAGALTRSATLFINGGTSGATSNYALLLGAGTTTSSPLGFTSGTNLTTPVNGVMEYNGTNLFFTRTGAARENVVCASAVNSVSPTSPNRTITVNVDGTTYYLAAKTTND